jgi:hypothetical protein
VTGEEEGIDDGKTEGVVIGDGMGEERPEGVGGVISALGVEMGRGSGGLFNH